MGGGDAAGCDINRHTRRQRAEYLRRTTVDYQLPLLQPAAFCAELGTVHVRVIKPLAALLSE